VFQTIDASAQRSNEIQNWLGAAVDTRIDDPSTFAQKYVAIDKSLDAGSRTGGHDEGNSQGVDVRRELHWE
jgi:hypothetical protein